MDPSRKRTIRLVVALVCALGFASVLVYTSFSAGSEAKTPSDLIKSSQPGRNYQLTGKVVPGSIVHKPGGELLFKVRDRVGKAAVAVAYTGQVPDPFRAEREVIVTVHKGATGFVGERDSLQTKCPSKFKAAPAGK
jgi:cytochrome c-type biogenesis protein CcmE